jgi:hypothetical protein
MPNNLLRKLINGVMPKGSIWTVKIGGFFDALLDGLADSLKTVKLKLAELADIRNAKKTTLLDELERDYGIAFNPSLTEAERRAALDSRINAIDNTGSREELERALQRAGFPVFVYSNSPAVDPNNFHKLDTYLMTAGDGKHFAGVSTAMAGLFKDNLLNINDFYLTNRLNNYLMVAGNNNAYAGVSTAIAGLFTADIVVNGDIVLELPTYSMVAGGPNRFAGVSGAFAGITGSIETLYEYFLPNNPEHWPFIFFVGGEAQFRADGSIISIERVNINDDRRLELREIVLKYKPTFTWAVLFVN